jgi:CheY-like chemotaxis protein
MKKHFDVLVIDDEQVVLDAVQRICSAENYHVETVPDAKTGLEKLGKNGYKLVLCDLMLPDSNGFKILEILSDRKIDIPVIMMTGYSTMENAVKSLNSGAIDFIPKPFTADELCSAIIRGLNYLDIREKEKMPESNSISFVSCPAKYFRLGYVSWISQELSGYVHIGITDLFLRTIQTISSIDFLPEHEDLIQGSYCANIKSDDGLLHPVLAPISGRILEQNREFSGVCSLLEKDPYFRGWLYKVLPSDYDYEIKNLVSCKLDML